MVQNVVRMPGPNSALVHYCFRLTEKKTWVADPVNVKLFVVGATADQKPSFIPPPIEFDNIREADQWLRAEVEKYIVSEYSKPGIQIKYELCESTKKLLGDFDEGG